MDSVNVLVGNDDEEKFGRANAKFHAKTVQITNVDEKE